jgi:Amt family ammonium transporter
MRFLLSLFFLFAASPVMAADATLPINSGDTAWMLIATALVMLMTPGLAFFYSGMVHSTNVVATIMHSYMKLCVIMLVWVGWGFSLSFGATHGGWIGGFDFLGLSGVGQAPVDGNATIPYVLFAMYQGMFAVITAAIITGAFAERVRLGPILAFSVLWITLVYAPVAHWVWGGGWIMTELKALDFAGGAVVHINSGVAGLVAALCLGRRVSFINGVENRPHNLPQMILGAALLWFGWFGFNAGSALAANGLAALAFANTAIAGAAGAVAWFVVESSHRHKITSLGIISGSIAGLVAITPAAGFVTPMASIAIGLGGGLLCYFAVAVVKPKLGYDDSLDAFGIHGVGGIWGAIATGLFATTSVNPAGADGLFYGNASLLTAQVLSVLAVAAYSAIATYLIIMFVRIFTRIRVSVEEEAKGLDASQHGEVGYALS